MLSSRTQTTSLDLHCTRSNDKPYLLISIQYACSIIQHIVGRYPVAPSVSNKGVNPSVQQNAVQNYVSLPASISIRSHYIPTLTKQPHVNIFSRHIAHQQTSNNRPQSNRVCEAHTLLPQYILKKGLHKVSLVTFSLIFHF